MIILSLREPAAQINVEIRNRRHGPGPAADIGVSGGLGAVYDLAGPVALRAD